MYLFLLRGLWRWRRQWWWIERWWCLYAGNQSLPDPVLVTHSALLLHSVHWSLYAAHCTSARCTHFTLNLHCIWMQLVCLATCAIWLICTAFAQTATSQHWEFRWHVKVETFGQISCLHWNFTASKIFLWNKNAAFVLLSEKHFAVVTDKTCHAFGWEGR